MTLVSEAATEFKYQEDVERITNWALNKYLYDNHLHLYDDFRQELLLHLWRESERYDPEIGTLGAFLLIRARWKVMDLVREATRPKADWRLEQPMEIAVDGGDREGVVNILDLLAPTNGDSDQAIIAHDLKRFLSYLNGPDRYIVQELELNERTLRDVGQELGLTAEGVRLKRNRSIERMARVAALI